MRNVREVEGVPRKIPQRTCLGCQAVKPKREMIRITRTPDGAVVVDPTGKKAGRGAYVCPSIECLEMAKKHKRFERALGVVPPPSVFEELRRQIEAMNESAETRR